MYGRVYEEPAGLVAYYYAYLKLKNGLSIHDFVILV